MRRATDSEAATERQPAQRSSVPAAGTETVAEQLLGLQRTAGNRAVARAILARDPTSTAWSPTNPVIGGGFGLTGISRGGVIMPPPIPDDVAAAVKDYVQTRKVSIGTRVQEGSISMPEVVAQARAECSAALRIEAYQ